VQIKNILVAIDFSENAQAAFDVACDLARQLGARLYALHVQDENTLRTAIREGLLDDCATDEELEAAVKKLNEDRLTNLISQANTADVEIERILRRGDPRSIIVDCAAKANADIVVVGRRGVSLIDRVVGHVTDSVIRKSPSPVVVVRREHKKQEAKE
jgi:universal stress protein A